MGIGGDDTLICGGGNDNVDGGDGNDSLYAQDGQVDTLDGGPGFDKAERDNTASLEDSVLNIESSI
jgi:Ca2+-binding RTX toxin-like protein